MTRKTIIIINITNIHIETKTKGVLQILNIN